MENIDHLIHGKWVITCEENEAPLEQHALAIKDGKILAILPSKEATQKYKAKKEIHYPTHALTPGLINAHTHSAMTLFRGLSDDLELMDWLENHIWPAEGKWVSEELVYDGTQLAIAEMIRCGTVCFNDMYFFLEATAQAAIQAGMRAHIGMHIIGVPTAWAKTVDEYFTKAIEFYEQYKNNALVVPTIAPHSTYMLSTKDLERIKQLSDDYRLKINIHLQEAPSEINQAQKLFGKRPLAHLNDLGLVTADLIAIHMTQIVPEDIEILTAQQPSIVHCPESNMKLQSGAAPIEQLRKAGLNIALGTDGAASNNDLDMLGEMRTAAFLGKITAADPRAVPAEYALSMATINGAKALGIDHYTGSLKTGKAADFIAINMEDVSTQPLYHPISQIVYAAARHQVTDVWVAGKQLMKNRELLTIDEKEILAKAQNWRNKIKS